MSLSQSIEIANKGLTFDIIQNSKVFPPIEIINSFFNCGIDDMASNKTYEWQPFNLNDQEYIELLNWCSKEYGELTITDFDCNSNDYSCWFTKAIDNYK